MNPENPTSFHGEDVIPSTPERALFHVIPAPFENSVSYGAGTAEGPSALLEASCQLELLTGNTIPANSGIFTTSPVDCKGTTSEVLERISRPIKTAIELGKIPVVLGGEHTVTCAITSALTSPSEYGVIQFDAHADLRASYEGSRYSHACVMRRIHEEGFPIYQLGTRSYSLEEREYRKKHRIPFRDAEDIARNGHTLHLPEDFPEKVYITFDIDGLDSGLMPATGTPVPGGLGWYEAMWLLEQIMETRVCIGFDVVEFAPIPNFHGMAFTAAQLAYNIMGYICASPRNRKYHRITEDTVIS